MHADLLAALAVLADVNPDAQLTITVNVRDLRAAIEARRGGPAVMTAEQASEHLGRTPEFWRRAAKAGKVAGAWQDAVAAPWHLPRDGCQSYLAALQRHGRRRTPLDVLPFNGGKARGPRKVSSAS